MVGVLYKFEPYELDVLAGRLTKFGTRIPLQQQPLTILITLIEHGGEPVTREELRKRLWPDDVHVAFDHSLNRSVNRLRQALCDTAAQPRFIETVAGHGYCFIAQVETRSSPTPRSAESECQQSVVPQPVVPVSRKLIPLVMVLGVTVLIALAGGLVMQHSRVPRTKDRTVLIVLPVVNMTGEPDREYVGDAITDGLIAELSRLDPQRLAVIARTSSMYYKNQHQDLAQIADEVHADYLLECSLRKIVGGYQVIAQLIRATDSTHVWTKQFDRSIDDLIVSDMDIAHAIATDAPLPLGARRIEHSVPPPTAAKDYAQATYLLNKRNPDAVEQSIPLFRAALAAYPNYASAYAGMAEAYAITTYQRIARVNPTERMRLAEDAAREALRIAPDSAEAHVSASVICMIQRKLPCMEAEARQALEINPNDAKAAYCYAFAISEQGRGVEALEAYNRALLLDPVSVSVLSNSSMVLARAGRYDESVSRLKRTVALYPDSVLAYLNLGMVYVMQRDWANALPNYHSARMYAGTLGPSGACEAFCLARLGRRKEAERILRDLDAEFRGRPGSESYYAIVYAGLGDTERLMYWIRRALASGSKTPEDIKKELYFRDYSTLPAFLTVTK